MSKIIVFLYSELGNLEISTCSENHYYPKCGYQSSTSYILGSMTFSFLEVFKLILPDTITVMIKLFVTDYAV